MAAPTGGTVTIGVVDLSLSLLVLGLVLVYKLRRDRQASSAYAKILLNSSDALQASAGSLDKDRRAPQEIKYISHSQQLHAIPTNLSAITNTKRPAAAATRVLMYGHDTLLEVMCFLQRQDILNAALVCTHWRRVASADLLWKSYARMVLSNRTPRLRDTANINSTTNNNNNNKDSDGISVTQRTADLLRTASSTHRWTIAAAPWNRAYRPVDVVDGVLGWKQLLATTAMCLHAATNRAAPSGGANYAAVVRGVHGGTGRTRLLEKHEMRPHHLLLVLKGLEELLVESRLCHIALFHFLSLYDKMLLINISDHHGFVFKVPPPGRGHVSCAHREFRDVLLDVGIEPRLFADWLTPALGASCSGSHRS